jgi:hypothetical protein
MVNSTLGGAQVKLDGLQSLLSIGLAVASILSAVAAIGANLVYITIRRLR